MLPYLSDSIAQNLESWLLFDHGNSWIPLNFFNKAQFSVSFSPRTSISGRNNTLMYNDTSSAWKMLSENMNHAALSKKVNRQSSNPSSRISNASSQDEGDIEEATERHVYRAVRKVELKLFCFVSHLSIFYHCHIYCFQHQMAS